MELYVFFSVVTAFSIICPGPGRVHTVQLNGAGASFPYDVYWALMPAYKAHRRPFREVEMKYEPIGSGGGKARMKEETGPPVAYAGSDSVLTEQEYQAHPDLQMLPSIAGAVVMAYHLPGIRKLRLSMGHLVGIYNGSIRFWNDSSMERLNPGITLPDETIRVAARREKSGTTELFTAALSAVDEGWKQRYGTFSKGVRATDDQPYMWASGVVTLYGQTNRGVSGMLLSTRFSIGYLVLSDAKNANLTYAQLLNAAGNIVEASPETVQSAMDDVADSFTGRMTRSLANPPGAQSYPISGYTYFIIRMTTMTDCNQATELVRYIEWMYTDGLARNECKNLNMVPMSPRVYGRVMDRVLKRVSCGREGAAKKNVYALLLAQKKAERLSLQTWRTPVYVATPIVGVLLIAVIVYLLRDQIRALQAILKDEWKIPTHAIVFSDRPRESMGSGGSSFKSRTKVYPSMSTIDSSVINKQVMGEGMKWGWYRSREVLLTELPVLAESLPVAMKRSILQLRDGETHDNVGRFLGLYLDPETRTMCSVTQFYPKGTLQTLLHSTRYNIDNKFKYALCMGVAKGMAYLHSHKLVHASLTSSRIYLDDNWSVRVCGWEVHKIFSMQKKSSLCLDGMATDWDRDEFWTAPEVLTQRSLPTPASDVYSFAIVMQEVFSRDTPYAEQSAFITPGEALDKVACESLRPTFTPDTPLEAREIMQSCWEMDPLGRPSMKNVIIALKKAWPKMRSVMDSMLDSLVQYVAHLEQSSSSFMAGTPAHRTSEQTKGTVISKVRHSDDHLHRGLTLPLAITRVIGNTDFASQLFESVSVLLVSVCGVDELIKVSTAQEVIDFVSDVHQSVETVLKGRYGQVLKVQVSSELYTLSAGIPQRSSDHLKVTASLALDLMLMASTFTIRHRREETLLLRMGLGLGSAVVGLAGHDSPMFTVLGDALKRAQTMLDSSLPKGIQLNDTTFAALAAFKCFTCTERQEQADQDKRKRSTAGKRYWLIGHTNSTQIFKPESK